MAQVGHLPSEPRRKKKRKKNKLPRAPRPRCGRPCALQRQVPAVRTVHLLALGNPVATQRQVPTVHSLMLPVQFLDKVFDMPVVVLPQVLRSMVQKTVVVPQLESIEGRRHPLRAAEADPHGPDCSADHGDSAVAAHFGGRCPSADSLVLPWRRPWRSLCSDCRKLQIFRSCSSSRSLSSCRDDESLPHGPCDHGDSPVAFGHGGQCSYYATTMLR